MVSEGGAEAGGAGNRVGEMCLGRSDVAPGM